MQTVLTTHVTSSLLVTVLLAVLWYQYRVHYQGLGLWVIHGLLLLAGLTLLGLRGRVPDWLSISVANFITLLAHALLYAGICRFLGHRPDYRWIVVSLAVFAALFNWFTWIRPDLDARTLVMAALIIALLLPAIRELGRSPESRAGAIYRPLQWMLVLYALFWATRLVITLILPQGAGTSFLDSAWLTTFMVLCLVMINLGITFALSLMVSSRLSHQLQARNQDLQAARDHLASALQERETLLRELYHRTKNNMQVITAILELQASRISDPALARILEETRNRIFAMALVHQKLYQAGDLSRINLGDYIQELLPLLVASYPELKERIRVESRLAAVNVSLEIAVPCGLVLNELVSNVCKHAFPQERQGTLTVELCQSPQGQVELTVSDDGQGLPAGFDPRRDGNMGLQTVLAIGQRQLLGQVELESHPGVVCRLRFALP